MEGNVFIGRVFKILTTTGKTMNDDALFSGCCMCLRRHALGGNREAESRLPRDTHQQFTKSRNQAGPYPPDVDAPGSSEFPAFLPRLPTEQPRSIYRRRRMMRELS